MLGIGPSDLARLTNSANAGPKSFDVSSSSHIPGRGWRMTDHTRSNAPRSWSDIKEENGLS